MLDANAVGDLLAENPTAQKRFGRHMGAIGVSSIVAFELHYGLAKSRIRPSNRRALDAFFSNGVTIVDFDAQDAEVAGTLRYQMEAKGKPLGSFDLLIAAQALRMGATLITRDAAFSLVKGLRVQDWTI